MREATGELNMTVIVVIAVAGLVALFSMFVFPMVRKNVTNQQNCSDAVCGKAKGEGGCGAKQVQCNTPGEQNEKFCCPYKG